ncbi:phytase [Pontibacter silvestris]|uniref:Phytase n=1 Tax=Pontibacter silvestris TaxID=2305183 RepID=A0ABW4WUT0_9BACT|nr:phytase [Pontibacter silvestris]MCC9136452.1 phytase [Pontibacter silvestris]
MKNLTTSISLITLLTAAACSSQSTNQATVVPAEPVVNTVAIKPAIITDTVKHDTDDPAIWVNPSNPAESLIIGTDKNEDGALYVFDLNGKVIEDKVVRGLKRPNNVDIEYGFMLNGQPTDIAVVTERMTHSLRIYALPDMQPIDNGGIPIFEGETETEYRDLMGIALYKSPATGKVYAIAGRKSGPTDGTYLWQYLLEDNSQGGVKATMVRKFGQYSGKKEIESIAVDDELGYIYYSDEGVGVRKYYAEPDKGNEELALFASKDFSKDHEGISIYKINDGTGYILVSDQEAGRFHIFTREGTSQNPHQHELVKITKVSTLESDGSEVTSAALNSTFPNGMFVAMSTDKTFQYYKWEDIAGKGLKLAPNGVVTSLQANKK